MMSERDLIYLRQIRHELYCRLRASYRGWRQWNNIKFVGKREQVAIVLVPQGDAEISFFALAYLEQMLRARKLKKAIIATNDPLVIKSHYIYRKYILDIKQLTVNEIDDLLQLYCLYKFDENFIVASLDCPSGRNGSNLIGMKGITKEEIFVVGIYGLSPFFKADIP